LSSGPLNDGILKNTLFPHSAREIRTDYGRAQLSLPCIGCVRLEAGYARAAAPKNVARELWRAMPPRGLTSHVECSLIKMLRGRRSGPKINTSFVASTPLNLRLLEREMQGELDDARTADSVLEESAAAASNTGRNLRRGGNRRRCRALRRPRTYSRCAAEAGH
jgi:hypothetical protein